MNSRDTEKYVDLITAPLRDTLRSMLSKGVFVGAFTWPDYNGGAPIAVCLFLGQQEDAKLLTHNVNKAALIGGDLTFHIHPGPDAPKLPS